MIPIRFNPQHLKHLIDVLNNDTSICKKHLEAAELDPGKFSFDNITYYRDRASTNMHIVNNIENVLKIPEVENFINP